MDYESKCLISSSSLKAEWTLESSNAKHVLQELAEVLPNILDSFWRKSGTRYVLICKPDSNLLKAVNKAVSKDIDVDTCEIWDGDKLILSVHSSLKSDVARAFANDIEAKNAAEEVSLQTNVGHLIPDVAWWIVRPSREHPLRVGNLLQLPDLWIEIAVNIGKDQRIATDKISSLRQHYHDSIVFLLFILPGELTNDCYQRIRFQLAIVPLANQAPAKRIQSASVMQLVSCDLCVLHDYSHF